MREIEGFFDKIGLFESRLGSGRFENGNLIVPVSGFDIGVSHPLRKEGYGYGPYEGELIFEGVVDSRREVTEYIGDPKNPEGFKKPREIIDDIPANPCLEGETIQEYGFEGFQNEPVNAWVSDWIVHARSFRLRIRDDCLLSHPP